MKIDCCHVVEDAIAIEDVDACHLAVSMKTLSDQVNDLKNAFNEVNANVSSLSTSVQDQRLLLPAKSKAGQHLPSPVLATTAAASKGSFPLHLFHGHERLLFNARTLSIQATK